MGTRYTAQQPSPERQILNLSTQPNCSMAGLHEQMMREEVLCNPGTASAWWVLLWPGPCDIVSSPKAPSGRTSPLLWTEIWSGPCHRVLGSLHSSPQMDPLEQTTCPQEGGCRSPHSPLLQSVPGTFSEGTQWDGLEGKWSVVCGQAQLSTCLMPRHTLSLGLGIFVTKGNFSLAFLPRSTEKAK